MNADRLKSETQLALRNYPVFMDFLLDILHFYDPAYSERDMILQNAAKAILKEAGWWGWSDSEQDRQAIVLKLTGILVPRRSLWRRLFRR